MTYDFEDYSLMTTEKLTANFWKLSMPATFFFGVAVRVWFYLLNSSFWRDESKLLLNIAQNSFGNLLHTLNYGQQGPIPYLWFLRVLWISGAQGELAMRGLSLAASILGFYFFYLLLSYFLSDLRAKLFSVALFALSPSIIIFAGITKQYSIDMLVAVLLLYVSRHWFISSGSDDRKMLFKDYVLVAVSPWFSFQAIFVILALGIGAFLKSRQKNLREILAFSALGCASFFLEWILILHQWASQRLQSLGGILFFQHTSIRSWLWDLRQIYFTFTGSNLNWSLVIGSLFATILLLLGIQHARRRHGWPCVMALLLPLFFSLGASFIKVYPMIGRYLIFSAPGIFLLVGFGLERFFISNRRSWLKYSAVVILLIIPYLSEDVCSYGKPIEGVREAMQFIADRWHEDDLVLCEPGAASSIAYYRLLKKASTRNLKFVVEPEKCIEEDPAAVDIPAEFSRLSNDSSVLNHRVWLLSETIFYPSQRSSSQAFKERLTNILNRFVGEHKIEGPAYFEDSILLDWEKIIAALSAERQLECSYRTGQARVYGFGKRRTENPGF
jgi:hypothetical protein